MRNHTGPGADYPGTRIISYAEIEELRQLLETQELQLAEQQEEIDNQRVRLQRIQLQVE